LKLSTRDFSKKYGIAAGAFFIMVLLIKGDIHITKNIDFQNWSTASPTNSDVTLNKYEHITSKLNHSIINW